MLETIALLFPSAFFSVVRKALGRESEHPLFEWAISVVAVNVVALATVCYVFGHPVGVGQLLNQSTVFWMKYVLLSSGLSSSAGLLSVWAEKNVTLSITPPNISSSSLRVAAIVISVAFASLQLIRIFNYDFWWDESFSVNLARMSLQDMLNRTASDVHPPLYYLILMTAVSLLGDTGWVYNFVSLIPYIATIVLALTIVWKQFGGSAAMVFVACTTFMNSALRYSLEVRMYSWAALFMLIAYLSLFQILRKDRALDWTVFCLASLAASYTHYYALLLVAFLYCGIIVLALIHRVNGKRVILSCVATAAGYAPWLTVLFGTFKRTSESFWMTSIPTFEEAVRWLFDIGNGAGGTSTLIIAAFVLGLVLTVSVRTSLLRVSRAERRWVVNVSGGHAEMDATTIWILVGAGSVLAVILTGLVVSELVRPLFTLRYLYPAAVLVWLLLGVFVSQFSARRTIALVLVLLMLHAGIPAYLELVKQDEEIQQQQSQTINELSDIKEGDLLFSDDQSLYLAILEAYFPGTEVQRLDDISILSQQSEKCLWLILSSDLSEEQIEEIASSGYETIEVCHGGDLGRATIHAYRLDAVKGGDTQ